jgi:hypothetical protein
VKIARVVACRSIVVEGNQFVRIVTCIMGGLRGREAYVQSESDISGRDLGDASLMTSSVLRPDGAREEEGGVEDG